MLNNRSQRSKKHVGISTAPGGRKVLLKFIYLYSQKKNYLSVSRKSVLKTRCNLYPLLLSLKFGLYQKL
eukprot:c35126_g1_i1 orf=467-673(+)